MSKQRQEIILPSGRIVVYQDLAHFVSNLLELYEVTAICAYRGNIAIFFTKGLFDNPSLVVPRIADIYQLICLDDPEQQRDIFDFLSWLEETCMPFLDHVELFMPDVRHVVDSYLTQRRVPPLHEILFRLKSHFFLVPRVFFCIFLSKYRNFTQERSLAGLAIAQFNGNPCDVSQEMAAMFSLPIERFRWILLRMSMLPQRKSFWRKVLTLSITQNFLIRRLLMLFKRSNICGLFDFRILMRVLSRFFR